MSFKGERSILVPASACRTDRDGGRAIDVNAYINGLEDARAVEIGIPLVRPSLVPVDIDHPDVRQMLRRKRRQ